MRFAILVLLVCSDAASAILQNVCPDARPPANQRRFASVAVEAVIANFTSRMKDKELACILTNTLPNTLDTTVYYTTAGSAARPAHEDTFVVTGDIDAMLVKVG